jgi:hypothetical protein
MLSLPVSTPNLSSFCAGQYVRLCVPDRMEVGEAITLLLEHVGMDASLAPAEVLKMASEIVERLDRLANKETLVRP